MKNSKDKSTVLLTSEEHKRYHESGLSIDAWTYRENLRLQDEAIKKANTILSYQEEIGRLNRRLWTREVSSLLIGIGVGLSLSTIIYQLYV